MAPSEGQIEYVRQPVVDILTVKSFGLEEGEHIEHVLYQETGV